MKKSLNIELRKQADRSISLIMKYINDEKLNYEGLRTKTQKVVDELQEKTAYKLRKISIDWNESENPIQVFRLVPKMFWAGMRPISETGNYGRFDTPEHPVLYTSPDSTVIFNEIDDLEKYKYKITYTLKYPIYVVAPFFYEESDNLVESQQQLKLNYFYNNILTVKKREDVNWNNRLYVVTNLILNRFDTSNADGFTYQSVETFRKEGMENGLTISNNIDPSFADANLALFSDDLFSKYKVEEI